MELDAGGCYSGQVPHKENTCKFPLVVDFSCEIKEGTLLFQALNGHSRDPQLFRLICESNHSQAFQ